MHPASLARGQGVPLPFFRKLIGGCAALALVATTAFAQQGVASKMRLIEVADNQTPIAQDLTMSLIGAAGRLEAATTLKRGQAHTDVLAIARDRYDTLIGLVDTDPAEVLRVALPADLRANLPAEAAPFLEQDAEEVGELEVYVVDHVNPALDYYMYVLNTTHGKLTIHFAGAPTTHLTGDRVRARGIKIGSALVLASGADLTVTGTKAAALRTTLGEQKTLVILVNFTDEATQPFTVESAQSTMFTSDTSVSNYFYEASYQQTWVTGDVAGWFTIPVSTTTCDTPSIATYAKQAATNAGFVLSNYTRYVYAFSGSSCTWWGMGTVGGHPSSQAWINTGQGFTLPVIGHEMGHNFGLLHSHSLDCGSVSYASSGCVAGEYGDHFDLMGNGGKTPHFSAFQKERLEWLNAGVSPPLTTISSGSAEYTIAPLENARDTVSRALKVSMATSCSRAQKWYYIESRQAKGFDDFLSSNADVLGGVLMHNVAGTDADGSYLLDMTPATLEWSDAGLPAGVTFTDPVSGLTITPTSVSGSAATISVNYPLSSCTSAAPNIALTPTGTQYTTAGATVTYAVSITNNDSCNCAASAFNISAAVPTGWSATNPKSARIAPGASGSTLLSVTSASSAVAAFYTIPSTATNAAAPSSAAAANATIAVMEALSVVAASDQATYVRPAKANQSVAAQITATVTSGGIPLSGTAVSVQVRNPGGAVTTLSGTTGSTGIAVVSYTMKSRDLSGTYGVTSTATGRAMSGSAMMSFVLQ